jgi:hypothetical protein
MSVWRGSDRCRVMRVESDVQLSVVIIMNEPKKESRRLFASPGRTLTCLASSPLPRVVVP